jgi:hypothetical protein
MAMTGKASFIGITGTVTVNAVALKLEPKSATVKPSAKTTELIDGSGELAGFDVRDRRVNCQLELMVLADTSANALAAMAAQPQLIKVTLASFPANSGTDKILINGDWISKPGDIAVSIGEGEAKITMDLMRPLTSALTIDQLLTAVT